TDPLHLHGVRPVSPRRRREAPLLARHLDASGPAMEMDASLAAAALLLGLAGGAHCVGMCGGIAGALAAAPGSRARPYAFTVAYHLGRAASYTAAGAIAGGFGEASLTL